ncbi:MAG TPA: polysaccharide deacetylase family protein [Acidimicrobiia bacterium]|nr:polysaccharide deacetylase family protein [Acidimicrobiia bacterium]
MRSGNAFQSISCPRLETADDHSAIRRLVEIEWSDLMAQVGDFHRRAQIVCAALVLNVAAGIGQADAEAAVTFETAQVAVVLPAGTDGRAKVDPPKAASAGRKVIYLTFDDGPTVKYTKRVLDLLDQYDAKATFFQVGENATAHPELARSVIERGHALGSHTWSHRDMRKLRPRELNRQITRTSAALHGITGRPVTCLRPPFGAVNARVRRAIRHQKLDLKLWDIDPRDWKKPGSAAIARRVVSRADPGDVSLMHDGGGNRSQSVKALERILRSLSNQRYDFKPLPGC